MIRTSGRNRLPLCQRSGRTAHLTELMRRMVEIRLPVAATPWNQPMLSPHATGRRSARPAGATTLRLPARACGGHRSGEPPAPTREMEWKTAHPIALCVHDSAYSMPSASICFLAESFSIVYRPIPLWPPAIMTRIAPGELGDAPSPSRVILSS